MARTGRPPKGRTRKTLDRDIATLRRLQRSIASDERIDAETACTADLLIERLIAHLLRLNIAAA
jgi:hypothetical protein